VKLTSLSLDRWPSSLEAADSPDRPAAAEAERLYVELGAPVGRYLLSLGLSGADAEEVRQETFLALHLHLRADKPRTHLRGWVFRVAHNLGLRRRRRVQTRVLTELPDIADPRLDPEAEAADRQRRHRILAAARALPQRDRCCLALRAEGLKYREIAEIMGVSLSTVAASMQRAAERLARAVS
jgi:RNA polymerase sigma-70 factor (ECF subfamily)